MKSDNYEDCPECECELDYFEGYEEYPEGDFEEILKGYQRPRNRVK